MTTDRTLTLDGLEPPSQELKDILQQMVLDCQENKPRSGGLKLPVELQFLPQPCEHDWQPYGGYDRIRRCSKCHVLGDPS